MRILVVDDDASVRATLRAMLEDAGFEVAEAADGNEAFRTFQRLGADLILCDLFMPDRDGLQLLRDLRAASLQARVIAMSGGGGFHGTVDLLRVAGFLGAVVVLYKPFSQQELLEAVAHALKAPAPD